MYTLSHSNINKSYTTNRETPPRPNPSSIVFFKLLRVIKRSFLFQHVERHFIFTISR